jgi:lambda repressor-like predicted transcriptional regulator
MPNFDPKSMAGFARANGLNPRTVRARRRAGWSWPETLSTPPDLKFRRRGLDSIAGQARAAGVPVQRTVDRVRKKGLSIVDAITRPLSNCAVRGTDTVNQRARAAGVSPSTIHARIRKGMPKEEALTKPIDKTRNYHYQALHGAQN